MKSYAERLERQRLAIFLLHGIVARPPAPGSLRNYTRKHIPVQDFEEFLAALLERGRPLTMNEVLETCRAGQPFSDRSFAITFDDGFANNLTVAAPVLRRFKIPACFYVTTSFVESNLMSWTDRLEDLIERAPNRSARFAGGDHALADRRSRIQFLEILRRELKSGPAAAIPPALDDLARQCGIPLAASGTGELDRKLNWDEVRQLARDPLFTVGGHSHQHLVLAAMEPAALEQEIRTSMEILENRLGFKPHHYSYPEGTPSAYSEAVIRELRRHGVTCCPTAEDGINAAEADPFRLKRIMVT